MTIKDPNLHMDDLLQHSDWVRSLARQLVTDSAQVDDLVQDTWVVALRRPPSHANNLRAWLGRVVTSLAQSSWRSETRRNVREEASARAEALPSTADLVQQASMSRELVDGVLGLGEPFRTVLLLRYFRDLTPTQIARETGRPIPTVKTQLQRGLSKLRERFDETYCDRDSWCTALLPLALAGAPVATTVTGLLPIAAALLGVTVLAGVGIKNMSEPALAPKEVFAVEALLPPSAGDPEKSDRFEWDGGSAGGGLADLGLGRVALDANATGNSQQASLATDETHELRGRVIDESGDGLNGVALVWTDPSMLQWADESQTVISGPHLWLPLSASKQSALLSDPAALDDFARDHFNRPGLAAAFLRGDPVPTIGTTTRAGGEFELKIPEPGIEIKLVDDHWGILGTTLLAEEPDRRAWFAGQRRNYIAELVDEDLHPVPHLPVVLLSHLPEHLGTALLEGSEYVPLSHGAMGTDDGVLNFGAIALSSRFSALVVREGIELIVPIDLGASTLGQEVRFQIQLPPKQVPEIILKGMVYLSDGAPAPRAVIVHNDSYAVSDSAGRYEIELFVLDGDLCAARAGSGVVVLNDVGAAFEGLSGEQPGPDLRLPEKSLAIRGRVLDHRNAPIPGAWVSLRGTIPLPGKGIGLEDLAGGRTLGRFETDAAGQFILSGLLPRDYTIVVDVGDRQVTVGPVSAGMSKRDVLVDLRD